MSEPIVFISNQRVKDGKLREYEQYYRQVAKLTETNKPGTIAHLKPQRIGGYIRLKSGK